MQCLKSTVEPLKVPIRCLGETAIALHCPTVRGYVIQTSAPSIWVATHRHPYEATYRLLTAGRTIHGLRGGIAVQTVSARKQTSQPGEVVEHTTGPPVDLFDGDELQGKRQTASGARGLSWHTV